MRSKRVIGTALLGCAALLALAGCTGDLEEHTVAESAEHGFPDAADFDSYQEWPEEDPVPGWIREPVAGWIDEGERFAVVTWWSSSCPLVANSLDTDGDDRLDVHFTLPDHYDACTEDLAPMTHTFVLPDATTGRPVTLTVSGDDERQPVTLTLD